LSGILAYGIVPQLYSASGERKISDISDQWSGTKNQQAYGVRRLAAALRSKQHHPNPCEQVS